MSRITIRQEIQTKKLGTSFQVFTNWNSILSFQDDILKEPIGNKKPSIYSWIGFDRKESGYVSHNEHVHNAIGNCIIGNQNNMNNK